MSRHNGGLAKSPPFLSSVASHVDLRTGPNWLVGIKTYGTEPVLTSAWLRPFQASPGQLLPYLNRDRPRIEPQNHWLLWGLSEAPRASQPRLSQHMSPTPPGKSQSPLSMSLVFMTFVMQDCGGDGWCGKLQLLWPCTDSFFQTVTNNQFNACQDFLKMLKKNRKNRDKNKAESSVSNKIPNIASETLLLCVWACVTCDVCVHMFSESLSKVCSKLWGWVQRIGTTELRCLCNGRYWQAHLRLGDTGRCSNTGWIDHRDNRSTCLESGCHLWAWRTAKPSGIMIL